MPQTKTRAQPSLKPTNVRPVARKPERAQTPPAAHAHPNPLVKMQSVVGNQGVQRMLIQRFPTKAAMLTKLGKPKRSLRIGHGSKKYKDALDTVDRYQQYIGGTKLDKGNATGQFQQALLLLERVQAAANAYQGKKGQKAIFMLQTLLPAVQAERGLIAQTLFKVSTGGMNNIWLDQTLSNAMLMSMGSSKPVSINESQKVDSQKGGMSEVTEYGLGGNKTGFFKPTKDTLTDLSGGVKDEQALLEHLTATLPPEEVVEKLNSLKGEYDIGVDMVGINSKDARMANRDVAMSRLDQLLGAGVIARAQLATVNMNNGTQVKGSLMEGAKGTQGAKLMKQGKLGKDSTEQQTMGKGAVNQQDPDLMRLMSKLQLIDLIAMQVDRNPKNFFIQTDDSGKVTGIMGIDNDMALGTKTGIEKRKQELPGMSRYVDKELAEKIINLDINLLRMVMMDLLSPEEIDALVERFKKVQDHLRDKKTQLLPPDQWTDAVAKGLTDEGKSYWSELEYNKGKYG